MQPAHHACDTLAHMGQEGHPESEVVDKLYELDAISKPVHNQRVLEAKATFALAYVLLIAGAVLIIWGALQSPAQLHVGKTAAGALISVIGGTVLKLHKSAHTQLDKFRRDRDAMHMLLQMRSDDARDKAIQDFVTSLSDKKPGFWKRLLG
jgi:hypothetical protein